MRISARLAVAAAAVAVVTGGASYAAVSAGATTLTCTGVQNATATPFGCGGAQLAYSAKGMLDLAVLGAGSPSGNYWNSPVGVSTDSQSSTREDFTVFAVNGSVKDGPGGLGEYVAVYTPDGKFASFTGTVNGVPGSYTNAVPDKQTSFQVGTNVYCISVENLKTAKGIRWFTVLRNCNTNGTFEYGDNTTVHENSVSPSHANAYQVWAPVSGANGLLLVNESLSHNFKHGNTPFVLDDTGFGGSGMQGLAYPENDGLNQEWSIIGCSQPITGLNTGYQFCP